MYLCMCVLGGVFSALYERNDEYILAGDILK